MNLSRGSRISSNGFGINIALIFVITAPSFFATAISSCLFNTPSVRIILAVSPKPGSSVTSRTIPRVSSLTVSFCFK